MSLEETSIIDLLQCLGNQTTCKWCKHPRKAVLPKIGLCSHCNRLRKELAKKEASGGISDFELNVLRKKVEYAQAEGRMYGDLHQREVSPLNLERELRLLSRRFIDQEIFEGDATSLGWNLCPNHRRYVFYLLSLINREYMRKNRRDDARVEVLEETLGFRAS